MKTFSLLMPLVLILVACGYTPIPHEYLDESSIKLLQENASYNLLNSQGQIIKKKYGVTLKPVVQVFTGERDHNDNRINIPDCVNPKFYRRDGKIIRIDLIYDDNRKLTIEEAREIHVGVIETLLSAFNSDTRYSQYMAEYPFTEKNIRAFVRHFPKQKETEDIGLSTNLGKDGTQVMYFTVHGTFEEGPIFEESYQEAKQKVEG